MGNSQTSDKNSGAVKASTSTSTSSRRKSRQPASREQLRAKSFLRREGAADHHHHHEKTPLLLEASSSSSSFSADVEDPKKSQQYIEKLEANVQLLASKCAALESQNILVSVQQLDMFARYFSLFLSLLVLFGYWKLMAWLVPTLLHDYVATLLEKKFIEEDSSDPSQRTVELLKKLSQNVWTSRVLVAALLIIPYLHNRWTHGSMHRRFQVFVVAFTVIIRIRMCRWREQMFLQTYDDDDSEKVTRYGESCTNDGIWEANYEISARFLYLSILRLRGLWTKTAQYMSSRADFVPVSYIRELSKLQDQAPSTPWEEVKKLLPRNLLNKLGDIEEEPMASASIGQVHIARLEGSDEKVVVKVQHPHARTLMMDDFRSLNIILRIVSWLEPEYMFMEILMREWATEAVKELDFRHEAEHLREASQAIHGLIPTKSSVVYSNVATKDGEKIPFQVEIPQPMEQLSSRNVLVMNFCEGCKIDDFKQMEQWGLSRTAVMDGVAQAFAHLMYCSTIFNGDPHAGNLLVRPGTQTDPKAGFTIVLLDWGLAKRLPEQKRIAFCQMVYAAATLDYGLLLDSYKTVGLKMKREDAGQSMEDMRFFLRDMAPRDVARNKIKLKMKQGEDIRKKNNEKVPMESKAYPGEFFFFIRVNELLHGLGSRFSVNLGYLDTLCPYAEKGLRNSTFYDIPKHLASAPDSAIERIDADLQAKLKHVLLELEQEGNLVGGQVCVLDRNGKAQADIVAGSLGGLRSHIPMQRDALILGYSTTKAIAATLAHIMVRDGYLSYDEPVCERVWNEFCPFEDAPSKLHRSSDLPREEAERRWKWKREITLRHILSHCAGLWSSFPSKLTIKKMASCEECFAGFEYNPDAPEETVLPTDCPSDGNQMYHFMSFGWLVAGTLCGAFAEKHGLKNVTFQQVYEALLEPKLSEATKRSGFRPLGGTGGHVLAMTVTGDIRASQMIQRQREMELANDSCSEREVRETQKMMKMFQGKEFLLDPRIWNSQDAVDANVPAAGGRFSAVGLANFYHDLAAGKVLDKEILDQITIDNAAQTSTTSIAGLQGVTRLTNDANTEDANHTKMSMGYQLIRTDRDGKDSYSGLGHAGVGGSIGFVHRPSGISMAVMVNKADRGQEVTMRILRVIGDHYKI